MIKYYKVNLIHNSAKGFMKSQETYKLYADPFTGDRPVLKENEDGTFVVQSESREQKPRRIVSTVPMPTIEAAIKAWNYRKGNGFFYPKLRDDVDYLIDNWETMSEQEKNEKKEEIFKLAIMVTRGRKGLEKMGIEPLEIVLEKDGKKVEEER